MKIPDKDAVTTAANTIRPLLGYVENGTSDYLKISQDDATWDYVVTVGKKSFYSSSLSGALFQALVWASEHSGE